MKTIIKNFNEISIDFLTQTSHLVGTSHLYKFKLVSKLNSTFAIDLFIDRVVPFKYQIIERDELFFLNKHLDDIIGINQIFHTLDENSKDNIWGIILALVVLAEERYNKKFVRNNSIL
jgi:hypothetical protein